MIVGCRSQACALQAVASLPSLGSGRAAACSTLLTFQTFNYSPTTPALLQSNVSSRKILFPIARACCSLLCTFRCKQFELITERRPGKLLSVAMDRTSSHVLHVWKDSLSKANPPGKKETRVKFLNI